MCKRLDGEHIPSYVNRIISTPSNQLQNHASDHQGDVECIPSVFFAFSEGYPFLPHSHPFGVTKAKAGDEQTIFKFSPHHLQYFWKNLCLFPADALPSVAHTTLHDSEQHSRQLN